MSFVETHTRLAQEYRPALPRVAIPGRSWEILNLPFTSQATWVLPGPGEYPRTERRWLSLGHERKKEPERPAAADLEISDQEVEANRQFSYPVFVGNRAARAPEAIILLHGLNERTWDKYLPWGARLAERLDRPVLLFPMAFHMNRAPLEWDAPRRMGPVSSERRKLLPGLLESSFVNAAISTRLQAIPERFFLSGLQTVLDIRQLMEQIRGGAHPLLAPDCRIDFFGYSIGAFITEILLLAEGRALFSGSRAALFCGGGTIDLMEPVSKFILDSAANRELQSFLIDRFPGAIEEDPKLRPHFTGIEPAAFAFELLLDHKRLKAEREAAFGALAPRLMAIGLNQDVVAPPDGIVRTLAPAGVSVLELDFPFPYRHENPFPPRAEWTAELNAAFDSVFEPVERHFLQR